MSLFELAADSRYVKVVFDAAELNVIRTASAFVSAKEREKMFTMTDAGLEEAARQAKKASDSEMTDQLVSLFRASEEILIEREDLAPVLERLKAYESQVPAEQAEAFRSAFEKITRCCV